MNSQAGKGDKPRNCFSKQYKDNYSNINWGDKKKIDKSLSPDQIKFCETKADKKGGSDSPESLSN